MGTIVVSHAGHMNSSPIWIESLLSSDSRSGRSKSTSAYRGHGIRPPIGTQIELGPLRPDPRITLRKSPARTIAQTQELHERLRRMDALAHDGPWTHRTLQVIKTHPGVRAGDLCRLLSQEKKPFKINVRKLKRLGLTESLKTGYRLSIRGTSLLATFQSKHSSTSRSKQ